MTIKLTFAYTGESGAVTIQWYRDGVLVTDGTFGGVVITGATTVNLVVENITEDFWGLYHAVATDAAGCTAQTQDFNVSLECGLAITQQPATQNVTIGPGNSFELTVEYTGALGNVTFQWYKDGVPVVNGFFLGPWLYQVSGATSQTLVVTNVPEAMLGQFYVVITDDGFPDCSVQSDAATVASLYIDAQPDTGDRGYLWNGTVGYEYFTYHTYEPLPEAAPSFSSFPVEFKQVGLTEPITWDISAGALPPGLTLDATTGSICQLIGTPTLAGLYNYTVRASDGFGGFVELPSVQRIYNPHYLDGTPAFITQWTGYGTGTPPPPQCDGIMLAIGTETGGRYWYGTPGLPIRSDFAGIKTHLMTFLYLGGGSPGSYPYSVRSNNGSDTMQLDNLDYASPAIASIWQKLGAASSLDGSYTLVSQGGSVPGSSQDPTSISVI